MRVTFAVEDVHVALDVVEALRRCADVPSTVYVTECDGLVTLQGSVGWLFQRIAAERVVRSVRGVCAVDNQIQVTTTVPPRDVRRRIAEAFDRSIGFDMGRLQVHTSGRIVTLTGKVRSWVEKNEAELAAWKAPGVANVRNWIEIAP